MKHVRNRPVGRTSPKKPQDFPRHEQGTERHRQWLKVRDTQPRRIR